MRTTWKGQGISDYGNPEWYINKSLKIKDVTEHAHKRNYSRILSVADQKINILNKQWYGASQLWFCFCFLVTNMNPVYLLSRIEQLPTQSFRSNHTTPCILQTVLSLFKSQTTSFKISGSMWNLYILVNISIIIALYNLFKYYEFDKNIIFYDIKNHTKIKVQ